MSRPDSWSHPSVVLFAQGEDPLAAMSKRVRETVAKALDLGWAGPPFDPIALAQLLGIQVAPREDIRDARIVPDGKRGFRIEFNPTRPAHRVRYSVAHEIAHTFFPDCGERIRHRAARQEVSASDWQVEALCNVGAAELLMPAGSLQSTTPAELEMSHLLRLRERYAVSLEALLLRVVKNMPAVPCAVFSTSRIERGANVGRYKLDYLIGSAAWSESIPRGSMLPERSVLNACKAIGHTAAGDERWPNTGVIHIEGVAIPPYPGRKEPRVAGVLLPDHVAAEPDSLIRYRRGDATRLVGTGPFIIAHIVNDATPNWSPAGFAGALRGAFPEAQADFRDWCAHNRSNLRLGRSRTVQVAPGLSVCSMIAQRGYGPSVKPRLRYAALATCLATLGHEASARQATVHMPRIGAGQAGGSWDIIRDMILEAVGSRGIISTVYDLPGANVTRVGEQPSLFNSRH